MHETYSKSVDLRNLLDQWYYFVESPGSALIPQRCLNQNPNNYQTTMGWIWTISDQRLSATHILPTQLPICCFSPYFESIERSKLTFMTYFLSNQQEWQAILTYRLLLALFFSHWLWYWPNPIGTGWVASLSQIADYVARWDDHRGRMWGLGRRCVRPASSWMTSRRKDRTRAYESHSWVNCVFRFVFFNPNGCKR